MDRRPTNPAAARDNMDTDEERTGGPFPWGSEPQGPAALGALALDARLEGLEIIP